MVELSVEPKRKQKQDLLLARMTGRRIDNDNTVVVVVVVAAVTFFFSAVVETGAAEAAQARVEDDFLPCPYQALISPKIQHVGNIFQ